MAYTSSGYHNYIFGSLDTKDENKAVYRLADKFGDNSNKQHARAALPTFGGFCVFEPEVDGVLKLYTYQTGCAQHGIDAKSNSVLNGKISIYHVCLLDEAGKDLKAKSAKTNEPYLFNSTQNIYFYENDKNKHDGTLELAAESSLGNPSMRPWRYKFIGDIKTDWESLGDNAVTTTQKVYFNAGENTYAVLFDANVEYEYEVKAGKTYFLNCMGTTFNLTGFEFAKKDDFNQQTAATIPTGNLTKDACYESVTLKDAAGADRKFNANTWSSICLPFSVTINKMREVFGDDVKVVEFEGTTTKDGKTNARFNQHIYSQMICAGVPYYILPSKDVTNPVFNNVTVELSDDNDYSNLTYATIEDKGESSGVSKTWKPKAKGGFVSTRVLSTTGTMAEGDYFMNGKLYRVNSGRSSYSVGPYRAYLKQDGTSVNVIQAFDLDNMTADETTGIDVPVTYTAAERKPQGITTIDGRRISDRTNLNSLPKGIYIVDGKKFIVK